MIQKLFYVLAFLSVMRLSFTSESCPNVCKCSTGKVWRGMIFFQNQSQIADCRRSNFTGIPKGLRLDLAALDMQGSSGLGETLRDGTFTKFGLYKLKIIVLADCGITHIEEDAFLNMNNLIVLSLKHNRLETLNLKVFSWTKNLRSLWLGGNPLKTFSGIDYVFGSSLFSLGLDECHLTSIPEGMFDAMKRLRTLRLNGNRLAVLNVDLLRPLSTIKELRLYNNPWKCDCHLESLRKWIAEGDWAWQLPELQCSEPPSLFNVTWDQLSPDNFTCDVDGEEEVPMTTGTDVLPSSVEETVTYSTFPKSIRNDDKLRETADIPQNEDHSTYLPEHASQGIQQSEQNINDRESTHGSSVWIFITLALTIFTVITIVFVVFTRRSSREFLANKWSQTRNPTTDQLYTTPRASLSSTSVSLVKY
jgi:hypothetical protein